MSGHCLDGGSVLVSYWEASQLCANCRICFSGLEGFRAAGWQPEVTVRVRPGAGWGGQTDARPWDPALYVLWTGLLLLSLSDFEPTLNVRPPPPESPGCTEQGARPSPWGAAAQAGDGARRLSLLFSTPRAGAASLDFRMTHKWSPDRPQRAPPTVAPLRASFVPRGPDPSWSWLLHTPRSQLQCPGVLPGASALGHDPFRQTLLLSPRGRLSYLLPLIFKMNVFSLDHEPISSVTL